MLGGQAKQWNRSREAEQSEQVQVLVPDRRSHLIDLGLSAVGAAIGIALTLWLVANEQSPSSSPRSAEPPSFSLLWATPSRRSLRPLQRTSRRGLHRHCLLSAVRRCALGFRPRRCPDDDLHGHHPNDPPPPAQTPCSWFTITPILWFSSIRSAPAFSRSFWLRCSGVAFGLGRNIR